MTKAGLREELDAARRRGYVVSHGERFEGAVGVSAPVRDARGRVVGDLIATWPDNRTDEAKEDAAGIVVRTAADDLSRRLGWAGPDRAAMRTSTGAPAMTEPIRIGIVGAGRIVAAEHVPRFRAIDGVELVGVANRSEESAPSRSRRTRTRARLPVVGGARRGPGVWTRSSSAPGRCSTRR